METWRELSLRFLQENHALLKALSWKMPKESFAEVVPDSSHHNEYPVEKTVHFS